MGIGTSAPQAKLEINTGTTGQSGLRFTQLTAAATPSLNTSKFLTVDASGNVVMGSAPSTRGRLEANEELWQKAGRFTQTAGTDGVIVGNLDRTPSGYKLYVQEGILTEKVKVAIVYTDQWSDKVFASTYTLQPLAQVERYIQQHQHLPGGAFSRGGGQTGGGCR